MKIKIHDLPAVYNDIVHNWNRTKRIRDQQTALQNLTNPTGKVANDLELAQKFQQHLVEADSLARERWENVVIWTATPIYRITHHENTRMEPGGRNERGQPYPPCMENKEHVLLLDKFLQKNMKYFNHEFEGSYRSYFDNEWYRMGMRNYDCEPNFAQIRSDIDNEWIPLRTKVIEIAPEVNLGSDERAYRKTVMDVYLENHFN